jgi:beta-lactamase regulating signal transducer with metallopeptidase domain/multidrug resistance efflux pump
MMDIIAWSPGWSRSMAMVALDVGLKGITIMVLAYAIHLALGRRRVLVRSVLWNGCLFGLLLLPVSALAFPRWIIACLPGDPSTQPRARAFAVDLIRASSAGGEADQSGDRNVEASHQGTKSKEAKWEAARSDEPHERARAANAAQSTTAARTARRGVMPGSVPWRFDPWAVGVLAYALVSLALALRLAASLGAVAQLRRSAAPCARPAWNEALARWSGRIGVQCRVRLMSSPCAGVPFVIGWRQPMIVLPESLAERAAATTIDAVLLHELAHVRRGDFAWNLVLRFVQVAYWPNPLAWLIGRTIVAVREQACDDLCIYWMEDAMSYRTTLLDVASAMVRRPREALGLAMARTSKLCRRIRDIEASEGAPRCLLRAPLRALVVTVTVASVVAVGMIHLARTASAQGAAPGSAAAGAAAKAPVPGALPKSAVEGQQTKVPVPGAVPRAEEVQRPSPRDGAADPPQKVERKEPEMLPVKVVKIERGDVDVKSIQSARLEAIETMEIHAQLPGVVLRDRLAEVSDRVKEGQVLAELAPLDRSEEIQRAVYAVEQAESKAQQMKAGISAADAALNGARAKLTQAEAELDAANATVQARKRIEARRREIHARHEVGQSELEEAIDLRQTAEAAALAAQARIRLVKSEIDEAEAQHLVAEAALSAAVVARNSAAYDLSRIRKLSVQSSVVAPFDGVVTKRFVNPGMKVRPDGDDRPLFVVSRDDKIRVVTSISATDANIADPGDPAVIHLSPVAIEAKVTRVGYEVDPRTLSVRAEIDIPNPGRKLRPGTMCQAAITLETHRNVLKVPGAAALTNNYGNQLECFRVVDGKATLTRVRVILQRNLGAIGSKEVVEGLDDGDLVLVPPDGFGGMWDYRDLVHPGQRVDSIKFPRVRAMTVFGTAY